MRPVALIVLALMTPLMLGHGDDEAPGNPLDVTARTLADPASLARLRTGADRPCGDTFSAPHGSRETAGLPGSVHMRGLGAVK